MGFKNDITDIPENVYRDKNALIENSILGEESQLYKYSKIQNSTLGNKSIVGDFSRIINSKLSDLVRIDRSNLIYHSIIGDYSYTGSSDVIMHTEIGRFSSISWGVTIGPGNHDYKRITSHDFLYNDYYGLREAEAPLPYDRFSEKCKIGNDVWIGTNSTVLRGVEIGNGAVVGANSVVTKDVPPYAIVVGSPAKIIKYRFSEKIVSDLEDLQWWNFSYDIIKKYVHLFNEKDISRAVEKLKKLKN